MESLEYKQDGKSTAAVLYGCVCVFFLVTAGIQPAVGDSISALSVPEGLSEEKIRLGDKLFHDPRFSSDNSTSCATCHNLKLGGVDNAYRSIGVGGRQGVINSPTVYNLELQLSYFWDGRAASLEEQISGPIHNPLEMRSSWEQVIGKLREDNVLLEEFEATYSDGIKQENIADAIAEFERSLVTVDSPFDKWLNGDAAALTDAQLRGYRLFQSYGCIACHQGKNVGGNMYATMGEMGDYFKSRGGEITSADLGRFNVTGVESDRHVFKVPSLRLAKKTAPYFHDGSVPSLREAISIMGRYQLGRDIPPDEIALIEGFIGALAGQHPRIEAAPE